MVRRHLQARHQITGLKYFTAEVSDRQDNPGQHHRQMLYLRALATLPDCEIIKGSRRPLLPPASPMSGNGSR